MVKVRLEFRKALNLLFHDGSITGFCYLTKNNLNIYEKAFWLTVIVMIAALAFYVASLWQINSENRTIISLDADDHPTSEVGFPGIAICNNNKIHIEMAEELAYEMPNKYGGTTALHNIGTLGSLYDFNHRSSHPGSFRDFQYFLEIYTMLSIENEYYRSGQTFDPSQIMQKLGTPCEKLLLKCSWAGQESNCMDIFSSRWTFEGICCTFNYLRPVMGDAKRFNTTHFKVNEEMKVRIPGRKYGLRVLISNDLDEEYMYSDLPTNGVTVLIFNPYTYPDPATGGLSKIIANRGLVTSIELEASVIRATENLKSLPRNMRRCIFDSENITMYGKYQQSDCYLECKVKSMLTLCGCLPFMIPREEHLGIRTCNLDDIPCLQRYKTKWMTNFPSGSTHVEELDVEIHDSIYCKEECLPNCDSTFFKTSTSYTKIHHSNNRTSMVEIYYEDDSAYLYEHDVSQTWFELLSNIGGVFSLFLGFSVLNVVEITYYLIYKIVNIY